MNRERNRIADRGNPGKAIGEKPTAEAAKSAIWTIGHSTRSADAFLDLLRESRIQVVADVRRFPGSRRYPHFSADTLRAALRADGRQYVHLPDLGGRRRPRPDSPNTRWRNEAFRGYADYMGTPGYAGALEEAVRLARTQRTAIMCSEAVWWRCHRSLIADDLKSRGWTVWHILGPGKVQEHPFTSAVRLDEGKLTYRD